MTVERVFLGWDAPVTAKVREFLLPSQISGPIDMENQLIVVPTRQAGRRLREALALYCGQQNTALLSPRVVTPSFFLHSDNETEHVASQAEVAAVWADVLMKANLSEYSEFFPARTPEQNFTWAMHTGEMIQRLRDTLVDGGYNIANVYDNFNSFLEESERWQDMSKLEAVYLARLGELGLHDPCELMIRRSEKPELREEIERIVIAAVPDPTPRMLHALECLVVKIPAVILIHAPESLSDHFDDWGRPIAEKWGSTRIDIANAEKNIFLTSSTASQSRKVMEIIAGEVNHFGPSDIAIGMPDSSMAMFLEADLADKELTSFDPAGKSVVEHPLYRLLESFRTLINERSYAGFSSFLRHADVLTFLERKSNLSTHRLLEELDKFQNKHLPPGVDDIVCRFPHKTSEEQEEHHRFGNLEKAVMFINDQLESFESKDFDSAIRSLLQTLYELRIVNPSNPDDEEFIAVARLIDTTLRELTSEIINRLGIDKRNMLELLLRRLSSQRYYLERKEAVIDLEGWLELPWNDAPFLIVTGMNEGFVPDGRLSDIFLPDSLRRQLNLRSDADRLARDAYLMQGLIESRHTDGRICFLTGKASAVGDPLKPSRLLFRCSDEELPQRAKQLFGDPDEKQDNYPPTISFLLQASPPNDTPIDKRDMNKLSVTRFKDYLTCPFRFYLKHILSMEALDDEKGEMDTLDFGSLVHEVLHKMAKDDGMRRCGNDHELHNFLCAEADRWITERFGSSPPLQIKIQLDTAKQRLGAAARAQAGLVKEGWEILDSEMEIDTELGGMLIHGKIDRIDRHMRTGHIRILDYKTSDKAQTPAEAHFGPVLQGVADYMKITVGNKEKRWADLQLPLYRLLLLDNEEFKGLVEPGYFNLPKAINDTGVIIWEGFNDELLEYARTCAESIVEDIQNRRFWPPIKKVTFDEFESLFPADIPDCIDVVAFENFMGEKTR